MKKDNKFIKIAHLLKGKEAFTLVEVLISITVLAIIIVPFTTLFMNSVNYNKDIQKKMEAYSIANNYMENAKGQELKVSKNSLNLMGESFPIDTDEWTFIEQDNKRYKLFIKLFTNKSTHLKEIINIRIMLKVTDIKQSKILVELDSDIVSIED